MKHPILYFTVSLICFACNHTPEDKPYQSGISTSYNEVGKLVSAYLDLKDALTDSDLEDAKVEAEQLSEKALKYKNPHSPEISRLAGAIAQAEDLEKQRELFAELSQHVIEFAKTGLPYDRRMYVLHCPMALGNKGADWLSEAKDVQNPYLGQKTLKCGEIKQEIQGK